MTAATYTSDLTDIFLFESITGVSAWNITGGGGAGLGASPDYAIEGTNAVDKQISASEKGFMHAAGAAHALTANDHYYIWINLAVYGGAATRDNRGICACIGDDTSNYVQFHVNGNDTLPAGGIVPYAIKFANTAFTNLRTVTGTPGTTPDNIGCTANVTITAKFSNLAADAARFGTGYTVLGGTSPDADAVFSGIASDDDTTAEGVFRSVDGGYKLQGKIRIGQSGTECELTDSNTNIFLANTLLGHADQDFSEILLSDDLSILTLTNVNFESLGTWNRGRYEVLTPLVTAQDETSYDNSPTSEGTFSGGTGHAVSDVITLDDGWTTVTVDAVSGGVVTQFTVDSTLGRSAVAGTAMTQQSTDGSGIDFSLTPDTDNILSAGTTTLTNAGFIGFGETIAGPNDTYNSCRWINAGQVTANGAQFDESAFRSYRQGIIDAQDETSYDNSPTTEGTFSGGASHAVSDVLTLEDGTTITVDAVSTGAVTQFTVDSSTGGPVTEGSALSQVSTDGSGTGFSLTPDVDNMVESAALVWDTNADPDGELDGTIWEKGGNSAHAIEFGQNSPLTMTVRNLTSTGYNASDDAKDSFFWVRRTSGTVTINVVESTGNFSYKSDGAAVNVVIDPVTVLVNVKDNRAVNMPGARVLLEAADATGDYPYVENVSITSSGGTATVTHTAHGLSTDDHVVIRGVNEPEYKGAHTITVTGANSYTYPISGSPASPATPHRLSTGQDETSYDNSPTTEGTFSGGTGHAVNDVLTLTKGVEVTVDAVSSGVVTEFTVDSTDARGGMSAGDVLSQVSTDGAGSGFSLTIDTDNLTISSSGAILDGVTDSSGNKSMSRTFSLATPVKGFVRRSSSSPRFKSFGLSGTISATAGLTINVRMILDENTDVTIDSAPALEFDANTNSMYIPILPF